MEKEEKRKRGGEREHGRMAERERGVGSMEQREGESDREKGIYIVKEME